MATANSPQMSAAQANALSRQLIIGNSQKMIQQIASATFNPTQNPILNIAPRNVGMILGFYVRVTAGVTNGATTQANRTNFGSANLVKNFTYTDLQNIQRINTSGAHIALLDAVRQGFVFGGSYAPNVPMSFGNNMAPFAGGATIAANGTDTVTHTYYLPLAYSSQDFRGAVWANIINATQNLAIQINTTPFVGATDPLNAIYSGNAAGAYTNNVTVTVYQVYYDQIPMANGQPVLPVQDLNTVYDLKFTAVNGLTAGTDFPTPYSNYRRFLSTIVTYDNGGAYNPGTDINYFALVGANSVQLFKYDPLVASIMARQAVMCDMPTGTYLFDSRDKPLDTINYGNLELVMNPVTVGANSQAIFMYESFMDAQVIANASSLASA